MDIRDLRGRKMDVGKPLGGRQIKAPRWQKLFGSGVANFYLMDSSAGFRHLSRPCVGVRGFCWREMRGGCWVYGRSELGRGKAGNGPKWQKNRAGGGPGGAGGTPED